MGYVAKLGGPHVSLSTIVSILAPVSYANMKAHTAYDDAKYLAKIY